MAEIAPLVAPAVDLSVVGLLLGIRRPALGGASTRQMRPAWKLLVFAGFATLALNVAAPLIERNYGRAAFDAVGPLLLIGWAEVRPNLLQAMKAIETKTAQPTSVDGLPATGRVSVQSEAPTGPVLPHARQPQFDVDPVRHIRAAELDAVSSSVSTMNGVISELERGTLEDPSSTGGAGEEEVGRCWVDRKAREQDLPHRARAEDVLHWQHYRRPISVDTLPTTPDRSPS
ncbi:hypothetical protein [Parafrankia discariae]|uniref:hypothetical protein n=1 Tax=Parafrankia discariae TaxID=365528 RepID=UPI00037A5583|nr:hypothetical protein [Parafrankia discariae]